MRRKGTFIKIMIKIGTKYFCCLLSQPNLSQFADSVAVYPAHFRLTAQSGTHCTVPQAQTDWQSVLRGLANVLVKVFLFNYYSSHRAIVLNCFLVSDGHR